MNKSKITISIVNYTNTLPFKWAIKHSDLAAEIDLQEDIPSICAQKLKFEQVDLALVPVALIPELQSYKVVSEFCIGAFKKVDSVKLYANVPLKDIKTITLDYQSKSSIALVKILCKKFWQITPNFINAQPGFEEELNDSNANVVIGDRTFLLNGKFKFEFDLAEEWFKLTGLPFVFAAWVSVKELDSDFIKKFNKCLSFGVNNISKAINESRLPKELTHEAAVNYLTKRIDYHLDENKIKGMNLFLKYLKEH